MNTIQIELRETIVIVVALVSGYLYLARTLAAQFRRSNDEQLTSLKQAIADGEKRVDGHVAELRGTINQLDSQIRRIEYELPREYVRRDDHVEAMATVTAKIDAVQAQGAHLLSMVARMEGSLKHD